LVFSLARLASAQWDAALDDQSRANVCTEPPLTDTRPFTVVLDKYQGSATRSYYGFDNTPFERALRDRDSCCPSAPRPPRTQPAHCSARSTWIASSSYWTRRRPDALSRLEAAHGFLRIWAAVVCFNIGRFRRFGWPISAPQPRSSCGFETVWFDPPSQPITRSHARP
jgi:hypothetical protein